MYRALLVCNSTYPEDPAKLPELHGPRLDGLILWRALADQTTGCFQPEQMDVIFERTSKEIVAAADVFFQSAEPGDVLLFYFSGHGRRESGELFLCGRDTVASQLLSTGVPCDLISKMMRTCHAEVIVGILDCCHGGAFKGDDDISHDLKGRGRFILAAAHATGLAKDADAKGSPSPFTEAMVEGLTIGAPDRDGDGYVELDDLYDHIESKSKRKGYDPKRDFDGSGKIGVARRAKEVEKDSAIPTVDSSRVPVSVAIPGTSTVGRDVVVAGGGAQSPNTRMRFRTRSQGDYSLGDLRTWLACLLLALVSIGASIYSWRYWPQTYDSNRGEDVSDPLRYASLVALVLAGLLCATCLTEGFRLRLRRPVSRRAALEILDSRGIRLLHRVRDSLAFVGAGLIFSSLVVQNSRPSWSIALGALGGICLICIADRIQYGDSAYIAGSVLLIVAVFLPYVDPSGAPMKTGLQTPSGFLLLLVAVGMSVAWLVRTPVGLLVLPIFLAGLVILSSSYTGELIVGPFVAMVGVLLTLAAVLMGCGVGLENVASPSLDPHGLTRSMESSG